MGKKSVAVYGGALTLLIGVLAYLQQSKSDDSDPSDYSAQQLCGEDYPVVRKHKLSEDLASVFLGYNGKIDSYCAVIVRSDEGSPETMDVFLQVNGRPVDSRSGKGDSAGPVFVPSNGECVTWGGQAENTRWSSESPFCGAAPAQ